MGYATLGDQFFIIYYTSNCSRMRCRYTVTCVWRASLITVRGVTDWFAADMCHRRNLTVEMRIARAECMVLTYLDDD